MMTLAEAAKGADPIRRDAGSRQTSSSVGYSAKASKVKRPY